MPLTLVDIKNHLFSHFLTESTFSLADDVASLKFAKQDTTEALNTHRSTFVKAGLDDMVKQGILVEASSGLYLLTQPLTGYSQSVTLDPMTIEMITDLVNGFGEALQGEGEEVYTVNKMAITAMDVARVCHLCHVLLDESAGPPPQGQ